jgi:hypothetical protein
MPLFGWGSRLGGSIPMSPEQQQNAADAEQEKIETAQSKEDARYDAMTEEEREKYYLKPSPLTKIKWYFRGE